MGWDEASQGLKGWRWGKKIFLVIWGEAKIRQDKTMQDRGKNLILWLKNGNRLGSKWVF